MWELRDGYVELKAPQKSTPWYLARRRVTASNVEALLGLSSFKTKSETIGLILGGPEKSFTDEEKRRMDLGNTMEDPVRKFHNSLYPNCTIREPSLCIGLKWYDIPFKGKRLSDYYSSQLDDPLHPNWWIGGSPDGEVVFPDGKCRNLELKYTEKGYQPLIQHHQHPEVPLGHRYSPCRTRVYLPELTAAGFNLESGALDYFPHIWRSHFFQMTTCMSITRKKECDYGVATPTSYYTETVSFDEKFWVYCLFTELVYIIEDEIKPKMSSDQLDEFTREIREIIKIIPKEQELRVSVP